eukprot:GFKZ01005084.1.p1 GENE.GFKZ01005084.1~~GFKZ01005084.1.p1  ORF type:complete len:117 (+),score=12.28 GFKZ01005084.1:44-394(+)
MPKFGLFAEMGNKSVRRMLTVYPYSAGFSISTVTHIGDQEFLRLLKHKSKQNMFPIVPYWGELSLQLHGWHLLPGSSSPAGTSREREGNETEPEADIDFKVGNGGDKCCPEWHTGE